MKVLITGPSGSGKTYLSKELKKLGLNTVDADTIKGLSAWYDGNNNQVEYPIDAGPDFFDNHSFLWNKEFLKEYLRDKTDIYILGLSGNILNMLDLFDKTYYLDISPQVMDERLQHPSRKNPMGNTEFQRKNAIQWSHEFKKKALNKKLTVINAEQTADKILLDITT